MNTDKRKQWSEAIRGLRKEVGENRGQLADLGNVENKAKDLLVTVSIDTNCLMTLKRDHELETKRLCREKPVNLSHLLKIHDQSIAKCEQACIELEKAKSSIIALQESAAILKKNARGMQNESNIALLFHIEELQKKFDEISWKIADCEEILEMGK